ncbi:pilus assembly protein PilW [Pseudomonas sp. Fl5BN2]|uniref:PilW family protein n=1 Tax=Pseudomonas sp. Fl5BN2 TaxID=2697652 RepID=UPI0013776024|nr:prepilin-type N-terminal cleavage/methylation domain-containing protein [Pseudomonas sp. Fl5BN2]NBF06161.1 pilus assembly protein PilW [Pseudomonas sp. Fl5BN2]
MSRRNAGFGLVEMMLALAMSLVLILGAAQVFISAKNIYLSQSASAYLQEDGRFVLSKMLQEIRMVGMFGCLRSISDASAASEFSRYAATPIQWDVADQQLTLITADVGDEGVTPTWSVVTDCQRSAVAYSGARRGTGAEQVFALRRLFYSFKNHQLLLGSGLGKQQAVLLDNVEAFEVSFGMARSATETAASSYTRNPGDPARIRSVRLRLILADPYGAVRPQSFTVVAALRNRLP